MTNQANNVQHQPKIPIYAWDTTILVCMLGLGRRVGVSGAQSIQLYYISTTTLHTCRGWLSISFCAASFWKYDLRDKL